MNKERVLFVDDDRALSEILTFAIRQQGREVVACHSVDEALAALAREEPFDAVITDLRMPGRSGMELVQEIAKRNTQAKEGGRLPVVVLTAHGSVDAAVEAMKTGAADFLSKPVSREVLQLTLDRVIHRVNLERENAQLKKTIAKISKSSGAIVAKSKVMTDALDLADRVAPTDATVLLRGESGTGKELFARRIHEKSRRADKAFVALNCAAIPRDLLESELFGHKKGAFTGATAARTGRFVEAHGGTFFLDEIGDLDLELQAKLLRVLEDGVVDVVGGGQQKVDVRIIAATNRDLEQRVRDGEFREDLYFRIRVIPLQLPPLRERGADIGLLFATFVERVAKGAGREVPPIAPELLAALSQRPWPGNVRELENVATRMVVTAPAGAPLTADQLLPQDGRLNLKQDAGEDAGGVGPITDDRVTLPEGGVNLEEVERALIVAALSKAGGNRSRAARTLGVARHFLLYRLDKFHITDEEVMARKGSGTAPIVRLPTHEAP